MLDKLPINCMPPAQGRQTPRAAGRLEYGCRQHAAWHQENHGCTHLPPSQQPTVHCPAGSRAAPASKPAFSGRRAQHGRHFRSASDSAGRAAPVFAVPSSAQNSSHAPWNVQWQSCRTLRELTQVPHIAAASNPKRTSGHVTPARQAAAALRAASAGCHHGRRRMLRWVTLVSARSVLTYARAPCLGRPPCEVVL